MARRKTARPPTPLVGGRRVGVVATDAAGLQYVIPLTTFAAAVGAGDVAGPGSATDLALARFDGATGKLVQNSLILLSDLGALTFPDNVRQTFNPGADAAGLNVGAHASDPGTPVNGDLYYDSANNLLRARINGAWVTLGAAGSIGDLDDLGDVDASAPNDGDVLTFDSGSSEWVPEAPTGGSGSVGDVLDVIFARKTSDESVTSSDVLQNDDELLWAMGANETWEFEIVQFVSSGSNTPDYKNSLNVPASAAVYAGTAALLSNATTTSGSFLAGAGLAFASDAVAFTGQAAVNGFTIMHVFKGLVLNGANAGNATLSWAQNTSNGTATTLKAGSYLIARRVA